MPVNEDEIEKLATYLRGVFAQPNLLVLQHPNDDDQAVVVRDQAVFAMIARDEEEGEVSYDLSKSVPDQPADELREHFAEVFGGQSIAIRRRKQDDSSEVYRGEEFLGVLYTDEGSEDEALVFNMAILDIDLEGGEHLEGREA